MNEYNIVKANINSIESIMNTVKTCIEDLIKKNIMQWNYTYPNGEIIRLDIEKGNLYQVKKNKDSIAFIVMDDEQPPEWDIADWSKYTTKPLSIHRLIVHPLYQNKNIGRRLMKFAIEFAGENNYDAIRFDAYSGNQALVETYKRAGCTICGEVFFPGRKMSFYCFEYIV